LIKHKIYITLRSFLFVVLIVLICPDSYAQFYNGLQMDFGKNRVQYGEFTWQFYRYKRYDVYFYVGGKELAQYTAETAAKKLDEIEDFLEYTMSKRMIFIVYNNLSDLRQSNIGLITGDNQYNIGGVTKIVDNKVFLYNEGDHKKLEQQISAAIAEVMLKEMLFGNDFKNKVANSTLISLPDWYFKGLVSYVSRNWDFEMENRVKDGILSKKYEKFNRLSGDDAIYAGHSIWNFIANSYGRSVIPTIIYVTRISKNIESGFLFVLGTPLKYLAYDWIDFYDKKFYAPNKKAVSPKENKILKRPKKARVYNQIKISPDNSKIIYTTNELGQYKIWFYDIEKNKHKKILKSEHKLDQITDYSYPVLAWHPSGLLFSFVTEREGKTFLSFYNLETKEIETTGLFGYDKVLDYSYSHDGFKIVMSAVKNGITDIFVHNIAANTSERITNDLADDLNPKFNNWSREIIFTSNRLSDTLLSKSKSDENVSKFNDVFVYDFANRSKILKRITDTKYINEIQPQQISKNKYSFLSDHNGVFNQFIAKYDSTVNYIDTSTHYRFFTNMYPVTNFTRNILDYDLNPKDNKIGRIILENGKHNLFLEDFVSEKDLHGGSFIESDYRKRFNKKMELEDSLKNVKQDSVPEVSKDTSIIDIRNYIFEVEKKGNQFYENRISEYDENGKLKIPKQMMYFKTFYTNYIVNQVDFGFLNSSYQVYNGGAFYFNPGFNVLFKIGTNDLFEDYKITGGFRFAGNFDSNEYLISYEDLRKRLDKQYIFHRQAFTSFTENALIKTHSHDVMYSLKYPFNQVLAVKGTVSLRNDRNVFLSTDFQNLNRKNEFNTWAGLKLEYIFDNTRQRSINIYYGSRFKIFSEFYNQVDKWKTDLFVVGADFRHYQQLHRNLIFATRFAISTSFGHTRLVYYLGSVDNWMNFSTKIPTFDNTIPIDTTQNYAYQTLATNMRGFTQNIRNGNSFFVMNNELRWPIISYLANRPLNSEFLANLQLIGFADIGTAWTGPSPYSKKNAYNTEIIYNNPLTIIIDKQRDPIVVGYGFGVRSKLLGYFIRADWAWGIDSNIQLPKIFYLSLSLDF